VMTAECRIEGVGSREMVPERRGQEGGGRPRGHPHASEGKNSIQIHKETTRKQKTNNMQRSIDGERRRNQTQPNRFTDITTITGSTRAGGLISPLKPNPDQQVPPPTPSSPSPWAGEACGQLLGGGGEEGDDEEPHLRSPHSHGHAGGHP